MLIITSANEETLLSNLERITKKSRQIETRMSDLLVNLALTFEYNINVDKEVATKIKNLTYETLSNLTTEREELMINARGLQETLKKSYDSNSCVYREFKKKAHLFKSNAEKTAQHLDVLKRIVESVFKLHSKLSE